MIRLRLKHLIIGQNQQKREQNGVHKYGKERIPIINKSELCLRNQLFSEL